MMTNSVKIIPDGGEIMIDKAKRNAAQKRSHDKTQYRTLIVLHKDSDADLIKYIAEKRDEGISPTQLFKEWYKAVVK